MSYRRLSLLFALDTFVLTPFRAFGSLYFLDFLSAVELGKLFFYSQLGRIIGTLVAGPVADRLGRKAPIAFSYPLSLLFYALLFKNPRVFYPIASFLRSVYIIAADVAIYESSEEKTFGYAIMLSSTDIAYILSLLCFTSLFGDDYFRLVTRIERLSPLAALIGLLVISTLRIAKRQEAMQKAYIAVLKAPKVGLYVLLVTLYRLIPPIFALFNVPLLYSKGISPTEISMILSLSALAEALASPYLSRLAKATTLYMLGQALRGSIAVIPVIYNKTLIVSLYFLYLMSNALAIPAGSVMDAEVVPEAYRATGISLIRLTTSISYAIGTYLAGFLREALGGLSISLAALIVFFLGLAIGTYVRKNFDI